MKIQFYKPTISDISIKGILDSGILVNGEYTEALEQHFKYRFGVKYAIACASGTTGLTIAIAASGYKNAYIGLPAFTWPSTRYAIECNNCEPIYYDINKETWLMDRNEQIFFEPELLIAVDTFGNECRAYTDIPAIYDAAHGYGLPNLGHRGLAEVVSFAATKSITGGQGGIILTNSKSIATKAKELVLLYAKITEISALLCCKSIDAYQQKQAVKERIIKAYRNQIKIPFKEQKIETFTNRSVYAVLLEDKIIRDLVLKQFDKIGIETKVYYKPLVDLENTNYVYDRILCLPVYEQIEFHESVITDAINKAIK